MRIRLGYVAIALNLKSASTSKTTTVTALEKLEKEQRIYKIKKLINENLSNLMRVLMYNKAYNIKVYRITSKLVPLATHPIIEDWNYIEEFKDKFKEIGCFIKENDMRISAHPDHYTVINSNSHAVFKSSQQDLTYHNKIFEAMGLGKEYKTVTHVGGSYNDKTLSMERFIEGFNKLPKEIAGRIILENDDKTYNITNVLEICKKINIPMVLDVHHHNCNNDGENLVDYLQEIFETWKGEKFLPKTHFSSPKNPKDFRSHADDINPDEFMNFIRVAKEIDRDFDVMLEAKNKDLALNKLIKDIGKVKGVRILDEGEFEF